MPAEGRGNCCGGGGDDGDDDGAMAHGEKSNLENLNNLTSWSCWVWSVGWWRSI